MRSLRNRDSYWSRTPGGLEAPRAVFLPSTSWTSSARRTARKEGPDVDGSGLYLAGIMRSMHTPITLILTNIAQVNVTRCTRIIEFRSNRVGLIRSNAKVRFSVLQ